MRRATPQSVREMTVEYVEYGERLKMRVKGVLGAIQDPAQTGEQLAECSPSHDFAEKCQQAE